MIEPLNLGMNMQAALGELQICQYGYFPEEALRWAIQHKDEIIPELLRVLEAAPSRYQEIPDNEMLHLYAMYLLAQFREKRAFPHVLNIASLPGEWPERLLGDTITEGLNRIIASTFYGDVNLIKKLIENDQANLWSRVAALRSLVTLVGTGQLSREFVISYLKDLFEHYFGKTDFIANDKEMITYLVCCGLDLHPAELYGDIKRAYDLQLVDKGVVGWNSVEKDYAATQEAVLRKNVYEDKHNQLIEDTIAEMKWWCCFRQTPENDFNVANTTYRRESPKIGRNDPCSCGSGKKFKKCCGKQ